MSAKKGLAAPLSCCSACFRSSKRDGPLSDNLVPRVAGGEGSTKPPPEIDTATITLRRAFEEQVSAASEESVEAALAAYERYIALAKSQKDDAFVLVRAPPSSI